ncbi:MAG: hypothetical protein SWK76_11430 [Actinomycetota bacterium]|nr:hypothetical protein [Actinomycetota bacterium]
MKVEKVVDEWLGPGEKDGEIIPIKPVENAVHHTGGKFYGEWKYFDAWLEDGHVVVGFIQASELMSRKPGIELHVYKPSGEKISVVKKFPRSQFSASEKICDARVGENRCYVEWPEEGDLPTYYLYIAEDGMEADLTFVSEVPGWMPGKGKTFYGDRGYFSWVVPIPRARVEGTVSFEGKTLQARGIGYHDHNVVTADMRKVLSFWYWGRLYTDDFTLLYAYVRTGKRFGNAASRPLMLAHNGKVIMSTGEVEIREKDITFNSEANRDYPAVLELEVPGQLLLTFEVKRTIDCNDFLSEINPVIMNPAVKWVANHFVRPGWFRFESDFTLHVEHEGKTYDREGTTLHEMVALR